MDAPLPPEPVVVAPVPEAPDPPPEPAPEVEPPFAPGSPDADRDPFRSDSVDQNEEGEYILDRALRPPDPDPPKKPEKEPEAP